ncbi:MAG TPA: MBL fold metallo-hydrolase [Ilumatobacter sp.]|nr:MBL fold metallo-hydrolase [Ilumatobacter sp.]
MPVTPFGRLDDVRYGTVEQVSPSVRRVIAENPSKYTYRGTGTYIVGSGDVAVIDPGPVLDSHRDALAAALAGERVRAICVTHCHTDHSPLAAWLAAETGAPTFAFGPHREGADAPPPDADGDEHTESIEWSFRPDVVIGDSELAASGGRGDSRWTLRAVHTPGHTPNHLCFALAEESTLFTGDHVMGWSTTVVSPPDGDMAAYLESLRKVAGRDDAVLWPTHGPSVTSPGGYLDFLIEHRLDRERQILALVEGGTTEVGDIVAVLYADVDPALHEPAARSVQAHLHKLRADGRLG